MLVFKRKVGQSVEIGPEITVVVTAAGPNWAKLGIEAPRSVPLLRSELGSIDVADSPFFDSERESDFLQVARNYCADLSRMSIDEIRLLEENPLNRIPLALARALIYSAGFDANTGAVVAPSL